MAKRQDPSDGVPHALIPAYAYSTETVAIDESPSEATPLVAVANVIIDDDDDDLPLDDGSPFFRDFAFAVVFFIHLAVMIILSVSYGSYGLEKLDMNVTHWKEYMDDDGKVVNDEDLKHAEDFIRTASDWAQVYPARIMSFIFVPAAFTAFFLSYLGTAYIIPSCPTTMVMSCLLGSIGWTAVFMIWMVVATKSFFAAIVAILVLGAVTYYVNFVWHMIPFAAENLSVALKGISANWGMYVVAFFFSCASFLWGAFWLYVTIGIMQHEDEVDSKSLPKVKGKTHHDVDSNDEGGPQGFIFFLLLVSLYWTTTIMINTIQVTVAGVMGTWCFVKNDARSCCSPAVTGSLYRSLTYSFGSICMGSLLQAVVTALRVLLQNARNRSRSRDDECGAVFGCILECFVRLLEDIIDYFNQWAYVFVGIYGYSYIESGKKVVELFKARGISSIVTNDLVGYVLGFTTTTVAVVNGLVSMTALILVDNLYSTEDRSASFVFGPIPGPMWWSFGIGFLVGIAMASVMMSVVRGAINTLIVCYADAPGKLEDNHPEETAKLSKAWSSIHPKNSALTSGPQYSMVV